MASNEFNSRQMVIVIFFKKEIVHLFEWWIYKNAGFSKLETQFWRFETLFVWVSSIPLVLACHAMLLSIVWRVKGRLTLLIYLAISQVILTQIKAKVQWNFSPRGVSAYSHKFLTTKVFQCIEALLNEDVFTHKPGKKHWQKIELIA